jgi:uncharacterized protein YciI
MFVVTLRYTRPLEEVDAVRREHLSWVDEHVAAGTVVAAGRLADATGGVLVMRAPDRGTLEAVLDGDPYERAGLVEREVVEFTAGRVAPGMEHLADVL